jgi:hypothetical protein
MMESTGNSEFSDSSKKTYTLSFWQNFLLTLAGAIGLISMVADGPGWITYPSLSLTIILLALVGRSLKRTEN